MKKLLAFVLLIHSLCSAQVKISDMPTHTGSKVGVYFPVIANGVNKKYDLNSLVSKGDTAFLRSIVTAGGDTTPIGSRLTSSVNAINTSLTGKQPQLNGTGYVKSTGTSITYDNTNYITANNSITGGTFPKVTYDAKGLITGGAALSASDIPPLSTLSGSITEGQVTGLAGDLAGRKSISDSAHNLPDSYVRQDRMKNYLDSVYAASQFTIGNVDGSEDSLMILGSNIVLFKRVKPGNGVSISSDATSITISAGGTVKVLPNADYTITSSDHTLILTEVAANRTITLPAASTMPNKEINLSVRATTTGRWLLSGSFVQKSTVGANPISENLVNSGLPNGLNYRLVSDGVKWYDINN